MSRLVNEDKDWLYIRAYLHGNNDEWFTWQLNPDGTPKYSDIINNAEYSALYEIPIDYKINKTTGEVVYIQFNK